MSTDSAAIRPKSFDEIRQAVKGLLTKSRGHRSHKIYFSQRTPSENRLLMRSRPGRDMRLRLQKNALSCDLAGRKLDLVLDNFDVKTEVGEGVVSFEFKLREAPGSPLRERLLTVENTKNPVFLTRALNAVTGLEQELPKERIEEASAAPTDYMVLVEALTAPSVAAQLAAKDPLTAARLRGVERQQSLVKKSGGVVRGEEVAALLGISRQAVDKRRRQGRLIGLTQGRRGYAYPAWQFEGGRTLANLERVLDALRAHDPWMQLTFFVNANDRLNGHSPLEVLRSGKLEPVLQAAASYGKQEAV
jgi:biotin operon repressor